MRVRDYTGQTVNHFLVIERAPGDGRPGARWLCRCRCGTTKVVRGIDLPRILSCGCARKDDLTGQRFGRLVAIAPAGQARRGRALWECRCDCGSMARVDISLLRNKHTRSCGCLHRERAEQLNLSHGQARVGKKLPVYNCWVAMHARCRNPHDPDYGGRGIRVCERWTSYEAFLADMGERPSPRHSIDRANTNGDYSPENCHWATKTTQSRNRRNTILLTRGGVTRPLAEWAELLGLKYMTIHRRLRLGLSHADALAPLLRQLVRQQ